MSHINQKGPDKCNNTCTCVVLGLKKMLCFRFPDQLSKNMLTVIFFFFAHEEIKLICDRPRFHTAPLFHRCSKNQMFGKRSQNILRFH